MATITTTYRMEVPGTDVTFEPEGPLPEAHDELWVIEATCPESGKHDGWTVSWLVQDVDADFEWADPDDDPVNWCNGVFRDFRNSMDGGGQEARDGFIAKMIEKVGADRVFVVEVYSHGLESFSRVATKFYPDRQWDVCPACVLAVPPNVTNPEEWADAVLAEYTSWACGDSWGVVTNHLKLDGTVILDDSCWGFIGRECAEEVARTGGY